MNTTALKSFAPAVRRQLMEAVTRKLDYVLSADTPDLRQAASQVAALRKDAAKNRAALVERVAYTWFNRFAALRFLDARGWHPFKARVLTAGSAEETQPELLKLLRTGSLPEEIATQTDLARLNDLLDGRLPTAIAGADPQGEAYRHLVLAACRFYHALLPDLFEKLNDETELLLPDDLLTSTSVAESFRTETTDEDCSEVELLGWLYQFYISEKKDAVMARKSAVPTEDIPAVTQLFTPHWIVRYLVENSLGRLWLLNRPNSTLREHMPYYIEPSAPQPPVWQEEWRHRMQFLEHDSRTWMWVRPNPSLQGNYEATLWYALNIDGAHYGQERWGIETFDGSGGEKVKEIEKAGLENASFEDLRYCLFAVQRAIKWLGGSSPVPDLIAEFHTIHAAVCQAWDREWSKNSAKLPDLSIVGAENMGQQETEFLKITKPEEIRLLDPAVGSGHMLTYAFDLLVRIYGEEGYAPTEIPALILRHNLHGLDLCPRAAQLAELALVFKAREKSRRFFQPDQLVRPNIIELRDVRYAENELGDYTRALKLGNIFQHTILKLLHQFEEAKNFGSLIQPCETEFAILEVRRIVSDRWSEMTDQSPSLFLRETHLKVLRVLEQAEALTQRYHVVVANPPYMGSGQMNASLATFVGNTLNEGKADMYAAFILRNLALVMRGGKVGMITIPNWMFLSSFEELRGKLLSSSAVSSLIHCGRGIWGSDFGSCAFILSHTRGLTGPGEFRRLFQKAGEVQSVQEIEANFLNRKTYRPYFVAPGDFRKITGFPFAYWVGKYDIFDLPLLSGRVVSGGRIKTHDGPRFIRFHWEIPRGSNRWRLFLKGGEFRKFYGNENYVVDWSDEAVAFYGEHGGLIRNEFRAKEGICWSKITVSLPSFRLKRQECEYDSASPTIFTNDFRCDIELLGYLNSKVGSHVLGALNPTVNTQVADVLALPFAEIKGDSKRMVVEHTKEAVSLARADWDNFETSWDFRDQPLLRSGLKGATLEASWRNWEAQSTAAISRMQELETENNRLFIAAYGLDGELQPEVPEAQITLARAEARRDMAAFLSYAVGCMMGRYSPDHPSLILANNGDSLREFLGKVGKPLAGLTFAPDEDGIIPVLDGEWFEDDIVARTRDFLRATFGNATLNENLRFIEESLGKSLEKYFLTDFYKDHLQTYKKRPIYWLFQSPKKGFSALVYLHRYTKDTANTLLNRYLRDYLHKLENRLAHLTEVEAISEIAKEKTAARKESDKLRKTLKECQDWEREVLLPLAQQRLEIDLDDGVKVNYLKFGDALAPIAGLAAKED